MINNPTVSRSTKWGKKYFIITKIIFYIDIYLYKYIFICTYHYLMMMMIVIIGQFLDQLRRETIILYNNEYHHLIMVIDPNSRASKGRGKKRGEMKEV